MYAGAALYMLLQELDVVTSFSSPVTNKLNRATILFRAIPAYGLHYIASL